MKQAGHYLLTFTYRFEAAHRFTKSCADSCATPHGHTWYAKAQFLAIEDDLGQDEMLMEFSKIKKSWKSFIQETVDHSFMHHYEDPILPVLKKEIPRFRGLPFPGDPTTEMIAALFFAKLSAMHASLERSEVLKPSGIVVRETPTNSIAFRAAHPRSSKLIAKINSEFSGWWQTSDPGARDLIRL